MAPGTTRKGSRRKQEQLRCLARLAAQAGVNSADAKGLGREGEAQAWADVREFLVSVAGYARNTALPVQLLMWDPE